MDEMNENADHQSPTSPTSSALSTATVSQLTTQKKRVATGKKQGIRFSNAWDKVLLKAVITVEVHLALHCEAQNRFEEALCTFVASVHSYYFNSVVKLT